MKSGRIGNEPLFLHDIREDQEAEQRERYRNSPLEFFAEQLVIQQKPKDDADHQEVLIAFDKPNSQQMILFEIIWYLWVNKRPIRLIILKERQWGCSTLIQAFICWLMMFVGNSDGFLAAQDEDASEKIFRRFKLFLDNMETWLKPDLLSDKTEKVTIRPEPLAQYCPSIEIHTASNVKFGRGTAVRWFHWSEVSHSRESAAPDTLLGVNNAIPRAPGTMVVLEATAKGAEGLYADEWERCYRFYGKEIRSVEDIPDVVSPIPIPVFFSWLDCEWYQEPAPQNLVDGLAAYRAAYKEGDEEAMAAAAASCDLGNAIHPVVGQADEDPEELELAKMDEVTADQLQWRRMTIDGQCQGSAEMFCQEYPRTPEQAFLLSGTNIFPRGYVMNCIRAVEKQDPPARGDLQTSIDEGQRVTRMYSSPSGDLLVWKEPEPTRQYLCFGDVGEGKPDSAFSVVQVMDAITQEQCAELHGRWDPLYFGGLMFDIGLWYFDALLCPEVTGPGFSTGQELIRRGYTNLYYPREVGLKAGTGGDRAHDNLPIGWHTNTSTRPVMVSSIRYWVHQAMLDLVHSVELLREMRDWYRNKRGKETHPPGKYDDRLMAWAGALAVQRELVRYGGVKPRRRHRSYYERITRAGRNRRRKQYGCGRSGATFAPKGGIEALEEHSWL